MVLSTLKFSLSGYISGTGYTLYAYVIMGGSIAYPYHSFLYYSALILAISIFCILPFINFYGLKSPSKKDVFKRKGIIKNVQIIGWACSIITTIACFICILISLILPWFNYDSLVIFMILEINVQNTGFFISLIGAVVLIVLAVILLFISFFTKKPWDGSKEIGEQIRSNKLRSHNFNNLLYWWYLCWNFVWLLLSTSVICYGISYLGELPILGAGLALYIFSAQFFVILNFFIGFVIIYYSYRSQKIG
ncbi:MAG: hypothetical protein ACTSRL_22625 [Candidatus Helarchaeota archaeon]